jgi:hypothetical protein
MRCAVFVLLAGGILLAQAPQLRIHEATSEGLRGVLTSPIPFSAVGVLAPGENVRVRGSADGQHWSDWTEADPHEPLVSTEPGSRYLEYETGGAGGPVRFVFIDPGQTPRASLEKLPRGRAISAPTIVSREAWGCPDGENARVPPTYTKVTHLIVHHTGDSWPNDDYPAWIRAIWAFHVFGNKWDDIGYNYLIDPNGVIYEGRAGGDGVLGAHFSCQNGGTMGVSLLGTFSNVAPAEAAVDSLEVLLAWRAAALGLDPLGLSWHRGMGLNLPVIASHRDGNSSPTSCTITECPGDQLYALLPAIRQSAADRIGRLYFDNLEQGGTGWTATGLWHLTKRRSNSPANAFWYGRDETGTYDTNGSPNEGTLESPPVTLAQDAVLTFRSWYETEDTGPAYDRKWVEINVDGRGWQPLGQISNEWKTWTVVSYPLTVRGTARVRFRFETIDGAFNGFEGWYVDDVAILASPTP